MAAADGMGVAAIDSEVIRRLISDNPTVGKLLENTKAKVEKEREKKAQAHAKKIEDHISFLKAEGYTVIKETRPEGEVCNNLQSHALTYLKQGDKMTRGYRDFTLTMMNVTRANYCSGDGRTKTSVSQMILKLWNAGFVKKIRPGLKVSWDNGFSLRDGDQLRLTSAGLKFLEERYHTTHRS